MGRGSYDTRRVDDLWDDISTAGQGIPIYESTYTDSKGNEGTGRGDTEHEAEENAYQDYLSNFNEEEDDE